MFILSIVCNVLNDTQILGHKVAAHIADLEICDIIAHLRPVISPDRLLRIDWVTIQKAQKPLWQKVITTIYNYN